MRNTSTVSGPLLSVSSTAPAGQQNRFAAVHLLTGQLLYFIVEGKSRVKDVNVQMATYMTAQGMHDVDLFSLATIVDDEFFFTDPESKLSKYSPKGWKSSSSHGLDQNGQPLLRLHLRVKYYVDTTKFLCDEISREHYYLQLRENIAARGGTMEDVNHQNVLHLVALGLQADLGDHTADTEITSELLAKYLPPKAYKNNEHKVKQTLSGLHKNQKGISKSLAQTMFVQEASPLHKAHLYRMKLNKSQPKQLQGGALSVCNNAWLAIFKNGIQLFHESLSQALSCLYLWNNVMKMTFDRKKFEMRTKTKEILVYYADSDEKCKRIVMVCQNTIEFNDRATSNDKGLKINTSDKSKFYGLKWTNEKKSKTKSNNIDSISKKSNDTNDEKICSENGDCSDSSILTADQKTNPTITTNLTTGTTQKVSNGSIISSSEDQGYGHMYQENSVESELDYSVQSAQDSSEAAYLMYRNPRARAGYVDNSNQSANTSSGVYTCPSYSSVSKDTASVSYTTENCSSVSCNGTAGEFCKIADATHAADRMTSSSSTTTPDPASLPPVVVAALTTEDHNVVDNATAIAGKQPPEAVAIDDCDGRGIVGCNGDDGTAELYDLSATSDGSYCAGGGATATTTSDVAPSLSSSKCGNSGCNSRCALNGYADVGRGGGGRSRSGSVVSNSGSFHGDGSDPPEGRRGALLSAAELSDLIVGRESLQTPRKGYYPSRPTTSSTLDSDSDYVTLPPPINFITGAPSLSNLSLTNFDCGIGTSACHWDVRHSFDMLSNGVKFCDGHHHHLPTNQCMVNNNNYLDVHKSGAAFYRHIFPTATGVTTVMPPLLHARQPPPPPPPPRPKQFDAQLEQYKQQLRSDVDFVVYPLQDPAISHQEYVDAKLSRDHVHQPHCCNCYGLDPPRYQANPYLYRSTPNVASGLSLPPPPARPPLSSTASSLSLSHQQYQFQHSYNQNQYQLINSNQHQLNISNNQHKMNNCSNQHQQNISNIQHQLHISNNQHPLNISNNQHNLNCSNNQHQLNISNNHQPLNISNNQHPLNISNNQHPLNISNNQHPLNISNNQHPLNISNNYHQLNISNSQHPLNISGSQHQLNISNNQQSLNISNNQHPLNNSGSQQQLNISNNQQSLNINNSQHQLNVNSNQQQLGLQQWLQQPPKPAPPLPPVPPHLKYPSNQSLLFPATVAASAEYAARNPHRRRPMYPMPLPMRSSYSHEDLLADTTAPAVPPKAMLRRRPPPPPPPINELLKPPPPPIAELLRCTSTVDACTSTAGATSALANVLDIESLREKSRNLDLPLISALCNDQTLLKQTNTLPTENKATQTATTTIIQATTPASLTVTTIANAAAAATTTVKPSTHQYVPLVQPTVMSSLNKEQKPQTGSDKSNSTHYTSGASSFSSQPPPSFLSAATPTSVNVSAAAVKSVKSVKSKTNHVKTDKKTA